jgi:hypothetical protein
MISKDLVQEHNIAFLHFVGPKTKMRMEAYLSTTKWKDYKPTGHKIVEDPLYYNEMRFNVNTLWNGRDKGRERERKLIEMFDKHPWNSFPKDEEAWEDCIKEFQKLRLENEVLKKTCSKIEEYLKNTKIIDVDLID